MRILCCLLLLGLSTAVSAQQWTAIESMHQPRDDARAVQLKDGRILIVGGESHPDSVLTGCEIFDPNTGHWSVTGNLNLGRYRGSVICLDDGRVLAIGGLIDLNVGTTETCELYDPITGSWQMTGSLPAPSENTAAIKLPNGKVFVCGGLDANQPQYNNFAVLFDPSSNSFFSLPNMPSAPTGHAAYYSVPDSAIVVAGGEFSGFNGYYLRSTRLLDLQSLKWSLGDSTIEAHDNGQLMAIEMPNGTPLLVSGRSGPNTLTPNIEGYNWITQQWTHVGQVETAHWHCHTFLVGQDSIFLVGGSTPDQQNISDECTWYKYSNGSSSKGPSLLTPTYLYSGILRKSTTAEDRCRHFETIYILGGRDQSGKSVSSCEELDLGVKVTPATITTFPNSISIGVGSCASVDTAIQFTISSCSKVSVDSVFSDGNSKVIVLSNLPITVTNGRIRLPIRISASSAALQASALKIFFTTQAGIQQQEVRIKIDHADNLQPFSLQSKLAFKGSICVTPTDSLVIQNPSCDTITIDSVVIGGADAMRFVGAAGHARILPFDSASVTISAVSDMAGTYNGAATIYAHSSSRRDTLRATLTATLSGNTAPNAHVILKDVTALRPGDTVTVPILLSGGGGTQSVGYRLHARYNTDLLQMLEPEYSGTLSAGTTVDDVNLRSDGADLFVPSTVTLNTGTLVTLVFKTYLTLTDCSPLELSSLIFSPDDPQFSTCILSTNLDSARICVQGACGNSLMEEVMAAQDVKIVSIDRRGSDLQVKLSRPVPNAHFEIFDKMGRKMPIQDEGNNNVALHAIHISGFPSGTYELCATINGRLNCRIFVVVY